MNVLVSSEWLRELVDLEGLTTEEIAARLSLSGPGVERLYPQTDRFRGLVVGHIIEIIAHPNADKLKVVSVNVGANQPLSIVCGGTNIKKDQWVVVALIGAKVRWHGEGDVIELKPTEIRGVASEGMICASEEIGLGELFPGGDHEILDLKKRIPEAVLTPGLPLATALGIEKDIVMDAEVTTNRPDAMGMMGFAREVAVVMERKLRLPKIKPLPIEKEGARIETDACTRFAYVKLDGVHVKPSPWWLKHRLEIAGIRSINNLVDLTNYLMLELGQPMHVYDAQKVQGSFVVRNACAGESLKALDGKIYELSPSMMVIADERQALGIAGIMGGEESSVTEETTSVIFEAATFNEVSVRKTSRALNLTSDAQKLFEKGLSTESVPLALARVAELAKKLARGTVTDAGDTRVQAYETRSYTSSLVEMETLIGEPISKERIHRILSDLGFTLSWKKGAVTALVPWWRDHDIESGRDLVEEVARVYGYANIQPRFPAGISPVPSDPVFAFADRVRGLLKGFGWTEAISYAMQSEQELERFGLAKEAPIRLQNPLSSDLEYLRTRLAPSMLTIVAENQERASALQLFELSPVYTRVPGQALPKEEDRLTLSAFGGEEPWRVVKGALEALLEELAIDGVSVERVEEKTLHPGRALALKKEGETVVIMGEVHPEVAARWKIEKRVALAELSLGTLMKYAQDHKAYRPISPFPEVTRDLSVILDEQKEADVVKRVLERALSAELFRGVEWQSTYRDERLGAGKKSLTFRLRFGQKERTLTTNEVDEAMLLARRALEQEGGRFLDTVAA